MFLEIVVLLVAVSIISACWSLRDLLNSEDVKKVQKELSTNRVVFQDSSSSSSLS